MTVLITRAINGSEITVRVEGYIREEDGDDLRSACEDAGTPIRLDLSGLSGGDRDAVEFVLGLVEAGAEVVAAPQYLRLLIAHRMKSRENDA
jgi:hypothetical protein